MADIAPRISASRFAASPSSRPPRSAAAPAGRVAGAAAFARAAPAASIVHEAIAGTTASRHATCFIGGLLEAGESATAASPLIEHEMPAAGHARTGKARSDDVGAGQVRAGRAAGGDSRAARC